MSERPQEQEMIDAWSANSAAWTDAVRNGRIASRVAVTNHAIVNAVTTLAPRSVLDVGCGEGWLARTLAERGIEVLGVDAVADSSSSFVRVLLRAPEPRSRGGVPLSGAVRQTKGTSKPTHARGKGRWRIEL